MSKGDFYLASAAVIPLLMFVDLAASAMSVNVQIPTLGMAKNMLRFGPRVFRVMWFFWWFYFGWAEWICLRSLEIDHSATGGSTVVWIALGVLGVQAMSSGLSPTVSVRGMRSEHRGSR